MNKTLLIAALLLASPAAFAQAETASGNSQENSAIASLPEKEAAPLAEDKTPATEAELEQMLEKRSLVARLEAPAQPDEKGVLYIGNGEEAVPELENKPQTAAEKAEQSSLAERNAMNPREALADNPLARYLAQNPDNERAAMWRESGALENAKKFEEIDRLEEAGHISKEDAKAIRDELLDLEVAAHSEYWPEDFRNPDAAGGGDVVAPAILLFSSLFQWLTQ